ncbi:MAG: hypothetical protein AB1566_13185 [Chloroflexota bacterium]
MNSNDLVALNLIWVVTSATLGLATILGLLLQALASRPARQSGKVMPTMILCLASGLLGYLACGFAFQFGGVREALPSLGKLELLGREWAPLRNSFGPGWGLLGLDGFFLAGAGRDMGVYALFYVQSALMLTAMAVATLPLAVWAKPPALVGYSLFFGSFLYPLIGNWAWGGGWLSQLGSSLKLGHGYVDYAGSGLVQAAGGLAALAGALILGTGKSRPHPSPLPEGEGPGEGSALGHRPENGPLAAIGLVIVFLGWTALVLSNTLAVDKAVIALVMTNVLLAAAGGSAASASYMAFTTGRLVWHYPVRGLLAGAVAVSAAGPFISPVMAVLVGAVAGLLMCAADFLLVMVLKGYDRFGAISLHGSSGLWGVVAVALVANGRYGQGWNGVGERSYLSVAGQGVSGLLVSAGLRPDPTQFVAQALGVATLFIWSFGLTWLFFKVWDALWGLGSRLADN